MRRALPSTLPLALALALLAACGAQPTPRMFGAQRFDASRGGHDYVVYLRDSRVEVIRLGYARSGEHAAIRETMAALVPELTGCRLAGAGLRGDSGEMRGHVACPGPS